MMVFSLFPLFSQFAAMQNQAGYAVHSYVIILDSQPTRCGHTLRGVHCRGLAGASRPSTPVKNKKRERWLAP